VTILGYFAIQIILVTFSFFLVSHLHCDGEAVASGLLSMFNLIRRFDYGFELG